MSRATEASAAHLAALERPGFLEDFGLAGARLLLAVGSHATGVADSHSDTDFLAVFAEGTPLPESVTAPGAVSLSSTLSANWIAQYVSGEVNVEMVGEPKLAELGALLGPAPSEACSPIVQQFDIRVLDRIRTGVPLPIGDQPADTAYLEQLRDRLGVARLPTLLLVMYLGSAFGLVDKARRRLDDRFELRLALEALAENVIWSTLCLYGHAPFAMKKTVRLLAAVEEEFPDAPLTVRDLDALWFEPDARERLEAARHALRRIWRRIEELAAAGDPRFIEALRGLKAYGEPRDFSD